MYNLKIGGGNSEGILNSGLNSGDTILNYVTCEYDTIGRVMKMTDYFGNVTNYAYDDPGRLASISAPGNKVCGKIGKIGDTYF